MFQYYILNFCPDLYILLLHQFQSRAHWKQKVFTADILFSERLLGFVLLAWEIIPNFFCRQPKVINFYSKYISRRSDVSNFKWSDQKIAPYHLVAFWVMTPKSDFLLIGAGTITPKVSMNTVNFGKTSLFFEWGYEQQTSNRLWIARVKKWFKKHFCPTHPL